MSSIDIYTILSYKSNNKHYLDRYFKFITSRNNSEGYTEVHHICPKAKDLFPEYASLKQNPWNKIKLTPREHFLCHWMLYKAFGGSQTYAFLSMCNGQKSKYQTERYHRINSKSYHVLREQHKELMSNLHKGMASYYDSNKNVIRCSTTDPRVLSKELISITVGKKYQKKRQKFSYSWDRLAIRYPNCKTKLYFLDMKIEVLVYDVSYFEYIEQGWSRNITKEYKTRIAIEVNKKMSKETRQRIGRSISKVATGKKRKSLTKEQRIELRRIRSGILVQDSLYYDKSINKFEMIDPLYIENLDNKIKVFTNKNSRIIWNNNGIKRFCSKECPTPDGYYDSYPLESHKIYNKKSKLISEKLYKDINFDEEIIWKAFVGSKIKVVYLDTNTQIFLDKNIISQYGMPLNCKSLVS